MSEPITGYPSYPVGTVGVAWGDAEKKQWLALQSKKRDYFTDVVSPLMRLPVQSGARAFQYGELDYREFGAAKYPLFAVKSTPWVKDRDTVIVTGGVHGYETSGVLGAITIAHEYLSTYSQKHNLNVLVLPCVSPWGYEHIQRWTPDAVDPNRCFPRNGAPGLCPEAVAAMKCIGEYTAESRSVLVHCDLHETRTMDISEFRPAKYARDGEDPTKQELDPIPDGFFVVGDHEGKPTIQFHNAVTAAVKKVTHIADPDAKGNILGFAAAAPGIIYPEIEGICGTHTTAKFKMTNEIFPDSERCSHEVATVAQVTAVTTAIDFALAQ